MDTAAGQMSNLVSNDVARFGYIMLFLFKYITISASFCNVISLSEKLSWYTPYLFIAPLEILVVLYLSYGMLFPAMIWSKLNA